MPSPSACGLRSLGQHNGLARRNAAFVVDHRVLLGVEQVELAPHLLHAAVGIHVDGGLPALPRLVVMMTTPLAARTP